MNNIISWNNQLQSSGFNFSCQQFCRDKIRNISHNNYVPSFAVWLLSVQYNISFLLSSLSFSSLSWSYFSETRCYFSEILQEPRTHKNIMRERKNWWNPPPPKKKKKIEPAWTDKGVNNFLMILKLCIRHVMGWGVYLEPTLQTCVVTNFHSCRW